MKFIRLYLRKIHIINSWKSGLLFPGKYKIQIQSLSCSENKQFNKNILLLEGLCLIKWIRDERLYPDFEDIFQISKLLMPYLYYIYKILSIITSNSSSDAESSFGPWDKLFRRPNTKLLYLYSGKNRTTRNFYISLNVRDH